MKQAKQISRWIEPKFTALALINFGLIIYASLFPFRFHPAVNVGRILIDSAFDHADLFDLFSNVIFYVPLGFFAVRAVLGYSAFSRITFVTIFGCVLSIAIEITQGYDFDRVTNMSDVYCNTAGTLLGALACENFSKYLKKPYVLFLLACWIGYGLLPFSARIDPAWYENALRGFLVSDRFPMITIAEETIMWLAVALLLESLAGPPRNRKTFAIVVFASIGIAILIPSSRFGPADAIGAGLSIIFWDSYIWRAPSRAKWIAVLFITVVIVDALRPFQFIPPVRHFSWIPFRSFLYDYREHGLLLMLQKIFIYGALVWVIVRAGWKLTRATLFATALVFCLRLVQIFIPNRSAEATDALMVLALGGLLWLASEGDQAELAREGDETISYASHRE